MSNLLDQWNEHIIKGNQLSRELEVIEDLIEKSKGEDICFTSRPNGATYITILSMEKMQELRENAVVAVIQARNEKTAELEKLMGVRKPATINPVFEAAVKEMVNFAKDHNEVDPVEEKLTVILQEETEKIEDKPMMIVEDVKHMYLDEGKTQGEIAEYYGVKKPVVNNFLQKNKLFRGSYKKDDGFLDAKVQARQGKAK
jgi:predicted XRE-type DNA-binding protein